MDNKYSFHSNCGCLHSDSDAALKAFSEETSQDTGCSDYYSQTNLHNLSDPDSLKKIIISKESIHALRLNTLQKRILITLNGIQLLLSNGPQPDGVEDLKRRQQRAAEFSSRFCRNYLYQLQRQINNITKMWKSLSNNHSHASYFVLCQKVITAHQNAHLALQAYLHHMPCSVERGIPDKLEEILQVVNDLCSFCSKLGMSEGDSNMKVVKQCCEQLMMQIKSKEAEKWEGFCTSPPHSSGQRAPKPFSKKEMIPYRFSMYSGNALDKTSNQNKKTSKISVGLTKKPSRIQCNKYNLKETNLMSNVKQNTTVLKNSMYVTYGSDRGDKQFGEVSSGDNVRTMMECFLAEEHSQRGDIVPATPSSNITSELVIVEQKEREETSIQNYKRTLRKLELEINNLKEQTQSLKENGHPNYPIYINMLETMFHQLNRMKSQKQKEYMTQNLECEPIHQELKEIVPLSLKVQIQNESTTAMNDSQIIEQPLVKQEEHKKPGKEYSKNVKLVCLTSKTDKLVPEDSGRQTELTAASIHNESRTLENSDSSLLPIIIIKKKNPLHETHKCQQSQLLENAVDTPNELSTPRIYVHQSVRADTNRITEPNMSKNEVSSNYSASLNNITSIQNNFKAHVSEPRTLMSTHLKISVSEASAAYAYHRDFQKYTKNHSLYEEAVKPWQVIARIASNLLDNVLEDIVLNDTGIQKITSGLLQLEFQ